jgi:cytochrome c6
MRRTRTRLLWRRVAGAVTMVAVTLFGLLAMRTVQAADVMNGAALYNKHCALCHGLDGRPVMPGSPDFSRPQQLMTKPDIVLMNIIRNGVGAMPAYQGQLRDREILDIVAHMRTIR